jgi:hypothetical protein
MNTKAEILEAVNDYNKGTFVKWKKRKKQKIPFNR